MVFCTHKPVCWNGGSYLPYMPKACFIVKNMLLLGGLLDSGHTIFMFTVGWANELI